MKPWVLLLKMSICGVVMLLPALGGVRKLGVWWGRRVFCSGLGSRHNWFRAQFPDSPFKGSEPFLKQRHPRKIRLDVPNLASLQAPSPRSENNIGSMERQHSFCLHFISSQKMYFPMSNHLGQRKHWHRASLWAPIFRISVPDLSEPLMNTKRVIFWHIHLVWGEKIF